MNSESLYQQLEKDFINPALSDDWARHMQSIDDFLSENFKRRSMGLVCDNSEEIKKVFAAVFPSNPVMQTVLNKGEKDAMLFVHHPSIWDIRKAPPVFHQMDRGLLEKFREQKISIYNLHVPLDNYGDYSTSSTLAKALGLTGLKPFFQYYGSLAAVLGKTDMTAVSEIQDKFAAILSHKASLYQYGTGEIKNGIVAVAAGGGNIPELLEEKINNDVNTLVTGVSVRIPATIKAHDYAKDKGINILGGTHYSTEKFACIAMCDYFIKLGLACEFIEDMPVMEDL